MSLRGEVWIDHCRHGDDMNEQRLAPSRLLKKIAA